MTHVMVIKYFVRAFKNTKRIFLRNSKYFRKILILYVCFDEVASNNVMVLNRNKINMNRYDMSHIYLHIHIFIILFSILSLISHAPSGPPYTPASYSHGIASLAG